MMILKDFLSQFKGACDEAELQEMFRRLAPAFLYGGYIQVRSDYEIYIRTVEFYFHSEKMDGVHDPIVYHRNGRDLENVPYFPLMTMHAHASGFDITFESEEGKYRASALIRSYEVKDRNGIYLKWDTEKQLFVKTSNYEYNTQSTYLYALLNGFALDNDSGIKWVDSPRAYLYPITEKKRQNVFQFDAEGKKVKCERLWSFTREEQV